LTPPGVRIDSGDAGDGSLELVRQTGGGASECDDLIADRVGGGVYVVSERISGRLRRRSSGLCLSLLSQPFPGERRQQLVYLWRFRGLLRGESTTRRRHRQDYRRWQDRRGPPGEPYDLFALIHRMPSLSACTRIDPPIRYLLSHPDKDLVFSKGQHCTGTRTSQMHDHAGAVL